MRVRTAEQLDAALAEDLVWRKKELSSLRLLMSGAGDVSEPQRALLRAALAVLYAHWEGFIKGGGSAYAEHVAFQRLRYDELAVPFLALATRKLLRVGSDSARIEAHHAVAAFFVGELTRQSSLPFRDAITTEANLSSRVLREILSTLGLDYAAFATKAVLIDEQLLRNRNKVAHGEFLLVDAKRYDALSHTVIQMMDEFHNLVSNAAATRAYERRA